MTGTHVLTVNQVLSLLLEYQQLKDWKQALLQVIPGRKHISSSAAVQPVNRKELDANEAGVAESESDTPHHKKQRIVIDQ